MKRSASSASEAEPPQGSHKLRTTAPPFVPQQLQPPQKMRRLAEATKDEAFGEARRRAHEQALRDEEEYQAWKAAELAADSQPDDEEQVQPPARHVCARRSALFPWMRLEPQRIAVLTPNCLAGLARRAAAPGRHGGGAPCGSWP